ncbi:Peptidoglycan glycosyltransferase [Candidatus Terasakiella magnetica]|uniref:Peptidoglycan glycosyltransferase n=1 Tax=Candidatus Terasakiella magnetica TaxID=1867952 RepID=A0A1C3REE4_9PROT|nr:penicillin-binding protein 2 [Candidatus Terasakiella magnetica]SCA55657.1 Peptidoglycan glycosyltransferase [Candidatus Terasakiella magnetica]
MQRGSDRSKLFSRRAAVLGGGKLVLLSALVGRMYYLQVVEAPRFKTMAEENRISIRLLPPPRGRIVDRFGEELAVNEQNYRVIITAEDTNGNPTGTLDTLGQVIEISEKEKKKILKEIKRKRSFVPVTVRENLTWEEVAQIEVNTPDLPGSEIDVGQTRHYPKGTHSAHVLGYVASVTEKDAKDDPLLELPGFRIGKSGVERLHDLKLRGSGGTSQVEVNALGRVIQEVERQEGQPGAEVTLTLDAGLQEMTAERLGEDAAASVVLDIHTGEVLSMASNPSYDPNAFNRGLSHKEWQNLITNPRGPLTNKAIAGQYAPGSTFKMVVALAALEKGVITPSQRITCEGHMDLGNARFHCWKKGGHGPMNMIEAHMHSCDIYFYDIAKRIGINRIHDMARRLGIGDKTGLDLPGERTGLMPSRDWKLATIGAPWQGGETLITGIGQGYVLATPLQLAVMTARLVSGKKVVPHLTRKISTSQGIEVPVRKEFEPLGINPHHLKIIHKGMNAVTNIPGGTAFRARIKEREFTMAGKTGTAQVRRISKAERDVRVLKNNELPWELRDHALFVGFAPYDNPRYAAAVVVEHGGSGSKAAAPIVRDILLEAQRRESARGEPLVAPSPADKKDDKEA